jgi:arylsulfatase A-like enzyme
LSYGNRFNRDLKALYDGHFKYIWGTNGCELYDIYNDPKELNNLVEEMPERVKEMQAKLDEWLKSFTPETSRNVTTIDKSTEESLRSLGYL